MEKLKMQSVNKVDEHIRSIGKLFPNCVTERKGKNGEVELAVDFDMLRQELSDVIVEGKEERYQFTWPDKKKSVLLANAPISATLRPCREESVNFDTTENLYIEGDNLDVLKLLQETYMGKIKMIYIDPPYNTGNDFVYNDDFAESVEEYNEKSGLYDNQGNRLVTNLDSNGRFHTDWLNMIYPRLKIAKEFLTDDGVIFISIDDVEQENLKKICDEIFGRSNFVATFPWRKRTAKSDVPFGVSQDYEWIVVYAKSSQFIARIEGKQRQYYTTPDFPNQPWRFHDLTKQTTASERPNSYFTIINPKSGKQYPANPNRTWAITEETFEKYYKENRIIFPGDYDFLAITKPVLRYWQSDDMKKAGDNFGKVAVSTKLQESIGMSQDGTKETTSLFGSKIFSFPKPTSLIAFLIKISTSENDIILDFFSGSATTAHATISQNFKDLYDGMHPRRKFILVQLPELCDKSSEAYKAGYKNICEIGKERIRRAGKSELYNIRGFAGNTLFWQERKNKEGANYMDPEDVDIGFRVLKLDSSNMKDVYYTPEKTTRNLFDSLVDNIKEDRTPEDLLFQVLLELGIPLSAKIEEITVAGKRVFSVNDDYLLACFDKNLTADVIDAIASRHPYYVVTRDASMANDSVKTSFEQILLSHGIKSDEWKVL